MNGALLAAAFAPAFAGAAWAGVLAGEALCAGRTAYDDGPAPVAVRRAPFALFGACAGIAIALHGDEPAHVALLLAVVFALSGCAAADLRCGALPDVLTLGALALVAAAGASAHDVAPALGAALVAVPFALAAFATQGRGMGWGDVKLAALGGALLGLGVAFAYMLAALAAYAVARRTGGARRPIAFGPYLAASIAATLALVRTS